MPKEVGLWHLLSDVSRPTALSSSRPRRASIPRGVATAKALHPCSAEPVHRSAGEPAALACPPHARRPPARPGGDAALCSGALLPVGSSGRSRRRAPEEDRRKQREIGEQKGTRARPDVRHRAATRAGSTRCRATSALCSAPGRRSRPTSTRKRAELRAIQGDLRQRARPAVRLRARWSRRARALAKRLVELYKADQPDVVTVVLESEASPTCSSAPSSCERVSDQDARIITLVRRRKADATATAARLDKLEDAPAADHRADRAERRNEVAAVKGQLSTARRATRRARSASSARCSTCATTATSSRTTSRR